MGIDYAEDGVFLNEADGLQTGYGHLGYKNTFIHPRTPLTAICIQWELLVTTGNTQATMRENQVINLSVPSSVYTCFSRNPILV